MRTRAFVLGGGGARGALQVGALRALLEAGLQPHLLVGTSVGAVNATYLAVHGATLASLDGLTHAWRDAAAADLLPANYLWLTLRALFNRVGWRPPHRMQEFFVSHGLSPDLQFRDLRKLRLILVAADLNSGRAILFGTNPQQSVLEGLLASTALPPWVHPLESDGQFLIDGGVVSNLPIEPALAQGAREIYALDLADPREVPPADAHGFGPFLAKLMNTVERRQREMEMALADACGVTVRRIALQGEQPVATWDFSHTAELIEQGYAIARQEIASWKSGRRPAFRSWLTLGGGQREVD
jgi:NTE family protein